MLARHLPLGELSARRWLPIMVADARPGAGSVGSTSGIYGDPFPELRDWFIFARVLQMLFNRTISFSSTTRSCRWCTTQLLFFLC
jgi:hypothetical protein